MRRYFVIDGTQSIGAMPFNVHDLRVSSLEASSLFSSAPPPFSHLNRNRGNKITRVDGGEGQEG